MRGKRERYQSAEQSDNAVWLTGFRFGWHPDREVDVFLMRLQAKNGGEPVTSGGRLVLFGSLALAETVLTMDDNPQYHGSVLPPLKLDEVYVYDVGRYLRCVEHEARDPDLINFLNLFYDLGNGLHLDYPIVYKRALYDLADHMTFSHDVAEFFDSRARPSRRTVKNALLWTFGAIVAQSLFVDDSGTH